MPDSAAWADVAGQFRGPDPDVVVELRELAGRVAEVTGAEPMLVDLSTDREFSVVKVIVPGTGSDLDRLHQTS